MLSASWRSPSGATEDRNQRAVVAKYQGTTEDRNIETGGVIRLWGGWRSPSGAAEDRNLGNDRIAPYTKQWLSPSGAAEDRNR